MPEIVFPIADHPALANFNTALNALTEAEAVLFKAKEDLRQAVLDLPDEIGDNTELTSAVINHLYWHTEQVSAYWIAEAFGINHVSKLAKIAGGVGYTCTCATCGQDFEFVLANRIKYKDWLREVKNLEEWEKHLPSTCKACKAKKDRANQERYEAEKRAAKQRLLELKTMPYRQYLMTPEWQERRYRHLKSSGFRCQVCNAHKVRLNVHHRTYERRGEEYFKDLITLCETCHNIFHSTGRLAQE